jgi:hypothetical protein
MSTETEIKRTVEMAKEGFVKNMYYAKSPVYHLETQASRMFRIKKNNTQVSSSTVNFLVTANGGGIANSFGAGILTLKTYANSGVHYCVAHISNLIRDWRFYLDSDTNYWYLLVIGVSDFAYLTFQYLSGNKAQVEVLGTTYTYATSSDKIVAPPYILGNLSILNSWTAMASRGNVYRVEGRTVFVNIALTGGTADGSAVSVVNVPSPYRIQTQSATTHPGTYKDASGNYQSCIFTIYNSGNIQVTGCKNNAELIGSFSYTYGV